MSISSVAYESYTPNGLCQFRDTYRIRLTEGGGAEGRAEGALAAEESGDLVT
jgi:hypothetical protein